MSGRSRRTCHRHVVSVIVTVAGPAAPAGHPGRTLPPPCLRALERLLHERLRVGRCHHHHLSTRAVEGVEHFAAQPRQDLAGVRLCRPKFMGRSSSHRFFITASTSQRVFLPSSPSCSSSSIFFNHAAAAAASAAAAAAAAASASAAAGQPVGVQAEDATSGQTMVRARPMVSVLHGVCSARC